MLRFSPANTKLRKLEKKRFAKPYLKGNRKIYSFDILAGHTCPGAKDCFAKVVETSEGLRIRDGKDTQFRCYAASMELRTNVYNVHKSNTDRVRNLSNAQLYHLISSSLPTNAGIVRFHSSGDFFNANYFRAWVRVATDNPDKLFYGYTKMLPLWQSYKNIIPPNMVLTASYGGKFDELIELNNFRYSTVVRSAYQARKLGLPVDNDDSHAANPNKSDVNFALIIHGSQPAGSEWAKVVNKANRRVADARRL